MKNEQEIKEVLDKVDTTSGTKFSSMTYEQGVEEALSWVLGEISDEEFEPAN